MSEPSAPTSTEKVAPISLDVPGTEADREHTANPRSSTPATGNRQNVGARVFRSTMTQLAGRAGALVLSAGTSILLARFLGRELVGKYGAIYAYLSLYGFLATFGLEQILAREASLRRSDAATIFHTGTVAGLSFAVLGAGLAAGLAPLFGYSGGFRLLIVIAAVDMLILPPLKLCNTVFQVDLRYGYAVGISLLRQVLWLAALGLLVLRNGAFYQVIVARTLCGVVEAFIIFKMVYRPGFVTGPRRFDFDEAKQLLRYAYPLALSTIGVALFTRIDQVMLHKMAGDYVLGPYVLATQLTEQFAALPVALIASLFPILSQVAGDEKLFEHYLGVSYRFLMFVALFACAVVTPVTGPVITLLYRKEFLSSAALINVLIWSEVPVFLGVALTNGLIAKNLQKYLPVSMVLGALMNIGLNLVFIPRWGAMGASWATVISYAFAGVLIFLAIPRARSLAWQGLRIALPLFAVALGITFLLRYLTIHPALKFAAGAALYTGGAWLTGTVRKTDLNQFIGIVRGAMGRARSSTA